MKALTIHEMELLNTFSALTEKRLRIRQTP